eukprot:TRINITY_DN59813_c0_g1_i1.p1 TRINITY_DN59813_c0_g1~~TRINITY_DN59813_c0_g1_i1.p1  ORF type:complete len:622 (-),score=44.39 TRINITY_DN59813_c0_g1_i1:318-2183(-)
MAMPVLVTVILTLLVQHSFAQRFLRHSDAPSAYNFTLLRTEHRSPMLGFEGLPEERQESIRHSLFLDTNHPDQVVPGVTLFAARNSRWLMLVDEHGQMVAAKSPDFKETNTSLRGTSRATSFVAPRMINATHAIVINRGGGKTSLCFYDFSTNKITVFYEHVREHGQVHHDVRYNPQTNEAIVLIMYSKRNVPIPGGGGQQRDFTDHSVIKVGASGVIWRWDLREHLFAKWWNMVNGTGSKHPCGAMGSEDWVQRRREMRKNRIANLEVCRDWMHPNSVYWDISENSVYLMCKHVNTFFKLDLNKADKAAETKLSSYNPSERLEHGLDVDIVEWGVGMMGDHTMYASDGQESDALFKFAHEPLKVGPTIDGKGNFIIFNNNVDLWTGKSGNCELVEMEVDNKVKYAKTVFTYALPEGSSRNMGSIQKLPNGNYLGQFPYQRVTVEVNSKAEPVWFLRRRRTRPGERRIGGGSGGPPDKAQPQAMPTRRPDSFSRAGSILNSWLSFRAQRIYLGPVVLNVLPQPAEDGTLTVTADVFNIFHMTFPTHGYAHLYSTTGLGDKCSTAECYKENGGEVASVNFDFTLYHLATPITLTSTKPVTFPVVLTVENNWGQLTAVLLTKP